MLATLYEDLRAHVSPKYQEAFIDGTYVPAKKGDLLSGLLGVGKRARTWQSRTAMVFHSLSLLKEETDTTVCSRSELSMLLGWTNYLHD